jgi:hypothetical protein
MVGPMALMRVLYPEGEYQPKSYKIKIKLQLS